DVHVKRVRAKVEPDPANPTLLVTVRGLGYKLTPEA
ncbi:MAG TPA: winged helix-turn-helix domain-containing protein, partial [Cellulomonas sp.]|nr:winged helix-turn-helix domain-containing protein [Cellulomonas sp.]